MLTLNKYLRELGINEKSWPFREIKANTDEFLSGTDNYDGRYVHQAPLKDGSIEENLIDAETWNMDNTLAMIIYSYLCQFREYGATVATPGCFCHKIKRDGTMVDVPNGHEKWLKTLDKMILAFRLYIQEDDDHLKLCGDELRKSMRRRSRKIDYGMRLFIKYFGCLGW